MTINFSEEQILSGVLGFTIGDALGVPVEFLTRETIRINPVIDMRSDGTHNQPAGTWSDDSSLTFCLMESLIKGYDLNDISKKLVDWLYTGFWTPHGRVFDFGRATKKALDKIKYGTSPYESGSSRQYDNGNGSLMRIFPLLFYIADLPFEKQIQITNEVSGITHSHPISLIACNYYLQFALSILNGMSLFESYANTNNVILNYYKSTAINKELLNFSNLLKSIGNKKIDEIKSSGYVVHSLEASIWSILKTSDYKGAVLLAVNLGEDTDTIGAITGSLAGLYYGYDSLPEKWIKSLVRVNDIIDLSNRFFTSFKK